MNFRPTTFIYWQDRVQIPVQSLSPKSNESNKKKGIGTLLRLSFKSYGAPTQEQEHEVVHHVQGEHF